MTAITVTATESGASADHGVALLVRVLTHATESGGASNGSHSATGATAHGTLTPNFSGSYIAFSISADNIGSGMPAAATNNAYDTSANVGNPANLWSAAQGHYTGTVTGGTALTYGAGSAGSADHSNWCAYEIPASGGTIAVDASSPAWAGSATHLDSGTSATTASFTPPASAVLVAQVCAGGTGSGAGLSMTVSDSSGLTWTQRAVSFSTDNFQPTWIFTATVASGAPTTSTGSMALAPMAAQGSDGTVSMAGGLAMSPMATAGTAHVELPYITGLAGGSAGHFVNQFGAPTLFFNATAYGLPSNAGRWNGGNWQADYDNYFADIAAQGNTVAEIDPFGHSHIGANNDLGNTYDGVSPWTTLPALNNTFWQRIDYLCASAKNNGITVLMVLCACFDMGKNAFTGTGVFNGVSAANVQSALQNIAARYASQPNLLILFGDDYNQDDDTRMSAGLTGLRAGGYTGPVSIENYPSGTTSRTDLSASPTGTPFVWGGANAQWNWAYYYWVTYFAVEQAYKENNQIPVVSGDGWYAGAGAGEPDDSHLMRNQTWWALASGARGRTMGSESILLWQSTAFTDLLTNQKWFSVNQLAVFNAFTSLTGWWNLKPDLTSSLVTAGRGTRSAYSSSTFQSANLGTDNYVAASVTPDKSLAVIYCAVAMSITIDQTKIAPGYTATWLDPANGTTTPATTGSTYNSSALGNNSAGDPDWVLILRGNSGSQALAPMAMGGTASVNSGNHGSLAMAPMALAGTATVTETASGSVALAPMALSGTVIQKLMATGSLSLSPLAESGTAAEVFAFSGSLAMAPLAESGAGTQVFTASGSLALAPMALSGTGTIVPTGSTAGSMALAPLAMAATATEIFSASGSLALAPMTGAGNAAGFSSTGSLAFAPMALAGAVIQVHTSAGSLTMAPMAAQGSATVAAPGSLVGSLAMAPMGAQGAAQSFGGSGSVALAPLGLHGTAATVGASAASVALAPLVLAGQATQILIFSGSLHLAPLAIASPGGRQGPPLGQGAGGTASWSQPGGSVTTDSSGGTVS